MLVVCFVPFSGFSMFLQPSVLFNLVLFCFVFATVFLLRVKLCKTVCCLHPHNKVLAFAQRQDSFVPKALMLKT